VRLQKHFPRSQARDWNPNEWQPCHATAFVMVQLQNRLTLAGPLRWSGAVTNNDVPYAQQTFDIGEHHHVGYGANQLGSAWWNKVLRTIIENGLIN